jgi:hypothetical protein
MRCYEDDSQIRNCRHWLSSLINCYQILECQYFRHILMVAHITVAFVGEIVLNRPYGNEKMVVWA